jgi:hypothetical protein
MELVEDLVSIVIGLYGEDCFELEKSGLSQ